MNTTKKHNLALLITFSIIQIFFYSCVKKEYDSIEYEGFDHKDVIPVGSTVLTIEKLINKQKDDENVSLFVKDGLYHLVYDADRIEYVRDYYRFPDEQGSGGKTLGEVAQDDPKLDALIGTTGIGIVPSDQAYTSDEFESDIFFDLTKEGIQDAELTRMEVREGVLGLQVEKQFTEPNHELILDVRLPGIITPSGNALSLSLTVPSGQTESTVNIDLSNHVMEFNQSGQANELTAIFQITINGKAGGLIRSSDEVNINYSLKDIEYNLVEGKIGVFNMGKQTEVSSINAFENSINNPKLKVKDPSFLITSESTLGVPSEIILHNLEFQRKEKATVPVELINNIFETPFIRDVSNKDIPVTEERRISNADTKSGNGISNVVEAGPDKQFTETDVLVNGVLDPDFFITYDSYLDMTFEIEIPLEVAIENYELIDTVDNYLKELDDATGDAVLREVFLDVFTVNTFPFDSKLTIFMIDVNGNPIDTLGSDVILKSPLVVNGLSTGSFKKDVRFTMTQDKYNRLVDDNVDRMVITASLFTPIDPNITHYKISPGNKLIISIQAGAEFQIK